MHTLKSTTMSVLWRIPPMTKPMIKEKEHRQKNESQQNQNSIVSAHSRGQCSSQTFTKRKPRQSASKEIGRQCVGAANTVQQKKN